MQETESMLVSIIMPTFNRANFIADAVKSVCAQTYQNWELIIIDDGSQDCTKEKLEPYLSDLRIQYYFQNNQGQSSARNKGLNLASGDYICFLDSDNKWLPEKLTLSLDAAIQNPDYEVIYGDNIVIDINGDEIISHQMKRVSGRVTAELLKDNFISMNTTMTKRKCFETMGGFDEKERAAEDYELWLRFSTRYRFLYLPVYLGYYRVMHDQLSTDKDRRFIANLKIISNFIAAFPDSVSLNEKRLGFSCFYLRKANYELSVGRDLQALKDLMKSFIYHPFRFAHCKFCVGYFISVFFHKRRKTLS